MRGTPPRAQRGVFLLEALIGIIIFSIGILTLVALQAKSIEVQSDTQYRIEAANLADRMLGEINLGVSRTNAAALQASLVQFAHLPTTSSTCNFTGAPSGNAAVTQWVTDINATATTRLPGTATNMQQIVVNTGTFNQVVITLCWQTAADAVPRQHTLVSYVN